MEFARRTEHRRVEPNDPSAQQIRRGWSFGAEDFVARLLDRIPGSVSEHHHARERSQTDEQRAEAIISARLKQLGWGEADLHAAQERPKEGRACQSPALANHDELEMDSPALRNGITDPRL